MLEQLFWFLLRRAVVKHPARPRPLPSAKSICSPPPGRGQHCLYLLRVSGNNLSAKWRWKTEGDIIEVDVIERHPLHAVLLGFLRSGGGQPWVDFTGGGSQWLSAFQLDYRRLVTVGWDHRWSALKTPQNKQSRTETGTFSSFTGPVVGHFSFLLCQKMTSRLGFLPKSSLSPSFPVCLSLPLCRFWFSLSLSFCLFSWSLNTWDRTAGNRMAANIPAGPSTRCLGAVVHRSHSLFKGTARRFAPRSQSEEPGVTTVEQISDLKITVARERSCEQHLLVDANS